MACIKPATLASASGRNVGTIQSMKQREFLIKQAFPGIKADDLFATFRPLHAVPGSARITPVLKQ